MEKKDRPLNCFVASRSEGPLEPALADEGLCRGMVLFAIPDYGVLFKCRAEGEGIDLEFAAFFALLKFVKTSLPNEQIKSLQVNSSNAAFVFSFSGGRHLANNTAHRKLLTELLTRFTVSIAHIEPLKNKALLPASEYPSIPEDRKIDIKADWPEIGRGEIKPFQRGISLS
ncbi:MAG: hypothetical protein KKA42_10525 [candidate division Zixibacteria bacterium]|nr:hypothetical protein [candidate division Zixibacteria bacterium]